MQEIVKRGETKKNNLVFFEYLIILITMRKVVRVKRPFTNSSSLLSKNKNISNNPNYMDQLNAHELSLKEMFL